MFIIIIKQGEIKTLYYIIIECKLQQCLEKHQKKAIKADSQSNYNHN